MDLLDQYFGIRDQIFAYFGYVEGRRELPLDDARDSYWRLDGNGPGRVHFADTEADLKDEDGAYYENTIYTQPHLPRWVYRGQDYTLIVIDTHTGGNQFLQIFTNTHERS